MLIFSSGIEYTNIVDTATRQRDFVLVCLGNSVRGYNGNEYMRFEEKTNDLATDFV